MKTKISAFACAAMVAAGGVIATFADATPYDKLTLSSGETWFSEQVGSPTANAWKLGTTVTTPPTTTVTSTTVIDVDTDATEPLTFTPSEPTSTIFKATFNLVAAKVPSSVSLADMKTDRGLIGFAIKETTTGDTTTKNFSVCTNGTDWAAVNSLGTPPDDGTAYTLVIEIDRHETSKNVRFTVNNGTPSDWMIIAGSTELAAQPSIDFVGTGYVKGLTGTQYAIVSEQIEITPGESSTVVQIKIDEAQMSAAKSAASTSGQTVSAYLNTVPADKNGLSNLDNIALFGTADVNATTAPAIKGAATEQPKTSGNVVFQVTGLNTGAVDGATVTYQLQGKTASGEWTNIGEPSTNATIEQAPGDYRFFRVITTVDYSSVNN